MLAINACMLDSLLQMSEINFSCLTIGGSILDKETSSTCMFGILTQKLTSSFHEMGHNSYKYQKLTSSVHEMGHIINKYFMLDNACQGTLYANCGLNID